MVSPHWGGSTNPDGGLKKPKVAVAEAAANRAVSLSLGPKDNPEKIGPQAGGKRLEHK